MNRLPDNLLLLGAILVLAGCNTFSDPEPEGAADDVGVQDAGSTDVGLLDGGRDSGAIDVGIDDAGDANDMGVPTNWTPTNGSVADVDPANYMGDFSVCSATQPFEITDRLPDHPDLDVLRIATQGSEQFAVVFVDLNGRVNVVGIEVDGTMSTPYVSEVVASSREANKAVSATSIGDQMVALVRTGEDELSAVQCKFEDSMTCREVSIDLNAGSIELFTIGDNYAVARALPREARLFVELLEFDDAIINTSQLGMALDMPGVVREIDSGVDSVGNPVLSVAYQDSSFTAVRFFEFGAARFLDGVPFVEMTDTSQSVQIDTDKPRTVFLHNRFSAWVVTSRGANAVDALAAGIRDDWWIVTGVAAAGARDFDMFPIELGYVESYVYSSGNMKILVHRDGSGTSTDPVQSTAGNFMVEAPARIAIAQRSPGVAYRKGLGMEFAIFCAP